MAIEITDADAKTVVLALNAAINSILSRSKCEEFARIKKDIESQIAQQKKESE